MKMDIEVFEEICAREPYQHKGMFYSEVFCFLRACSTHAVDLIMESGVKNGMSTRLIASAWPSDLIAIDKAPIRLSLHGLTPAFAIRVQLIRGDSLEIIPALLKEKASAQPPRRIGVLIDGPKGSAALRLKDSCLSAPNCFVVGCHDQPVGLGESSHSHAPDFRLLAGHLDRFVADAYRAKYPNGPGLSLWEKTPCAS